MKKTPTWEYKDKAMKILVVGAGGLGYHVAEKLAGESNDVTVIEQCEQRVRHVLEHLDVQAIIGSGSSPKVLEEAGIKEADVLIAVTDSDEVNMVACLIAAAQCRTPRKIARIRDRELLKETRLMGRDFLDIDYFVNPDEQVVRAIQRVIRIPGCTDLAEFFEGKVVVAGFQVEESSVLTQATLAELWSQNLTKNKLLIAAIQRNKKLFIPDGSFRIQGGDIAFVVSEADKLQDLYPLFAVKEQDVQKIMISGGSRNAVELAYALQEEDSLSVTMIEPSKNVCSALAEKLSGALVICGDPHDEDLLKEEHIEETDVFLSMSEEDDENILVGLLAKSLGANRIITIVNQSHYIPIVQAVANQVAVSPKMIAVAQIVQFIRKGRVLALSSLGDDQLEALEVVAQEGSSLVGKPIHTLGLPNGIIIGAILREGQILIVDGNTVIKAGDRVVILTHRDLVVQLESLLETKVS